METKEYLDRAILMAAAHHKDHYDKTGRPSILHPLRVMDKLDTGDERHMKHMIVAVLHDTVEDTAMTLRDIRDAFPVDIHDAVDAMTRRENEVYADYIRRCGQNPLARTVKRADLLDNMTRNDGLPIDEKNGLMKRYEKALGVLDDIDKMNPPEQ